MEYQDPAWIADLKARHPGLFCNIGRYNFDVGPGWQGIVTEVCEALDSLGMADLRVFQIKEKFGGLRIYPEWDGDDLRPDVWEIIQQAEDLASHVCEMCGKPSETVNASTFCQTCRAGDRRRFPVDAEKWEAFQEALEATPRPMPRLKKLLTEPGYFDAGVPRRISPEELAAHTGQAMERFKSVLEALAQGAPISLTPEDQDAIAEGLLNPPPLAPATLRALERLKAFRTPPSDDPEAQ